jgi:hypothetical protein
MSRAVRSATPAEQRGAKGDCYIAAFECAMAIVIGDPDLAPLVCHGTVTGQGKLEGIRFGHAWVEVPPLRLTFDTANGRNVVMATDRYLELAEASDVRRYTTAEIWTRVKAAGHYGPDWDVTPKRSHARRRRSTTG